MTEQPLHRRRILVVEDEYFIADDVTRMLRSAGAIVVGPTPSADIALQEIETLAPHAAVLDINLNEARVYALADALRHRGIPFAFFTGYSVEMIPAPYRDVPRWEKPGDASQVVAGLTALLDRRN